MRSFEGFLESVVFIDDELRLRFVTGGFDPFPSEPPVLYVVVFQPVAAEVSYEALRNICESDEGTYFAVVGEGEALVQGDHGQEVKVQGARVEVEPRPFEARDFERLAKANHEWGRQIRESLKTALSQNAAVRSLVQQQAARIEIKLQGHEVGSTARTLYEQHLSFLNRVGHELGG